MAEAIAALGLACSVFQVISFAHEVYNVSKEIKETGSSDAVALYHAAQLSKLSTTLRDKTNEVHPATKEQFVLQSHAEKCLELSLKLQQDLKLEGKGNGLRKALKSRWNKSSTKKHAEQLSILEQSMQTQILAYSWIRNQATQAEQEQGFKDVDTQLQVFIRQVIAGHTKLEDLLAKESATTRDHTTVEAVKIRAHVTAETSRTTDYMAQESEVQKRQARMAKLLKSLEYSEMNARRNQSSIDAHETTFQWIFEEDDKLAWDSFPSFLGSKDQTLYWISGKPGAGKSTLMKFLVRHDRTIEILETWSPNSLIVSFFFWLNGSPMQRSMKGLMSSLVHQILDSTTETLDFPPDSEVWRKSYIDDWSIQELSKVLFHCLAAPTRPVCLFLDGLDEIDQKEGPFDLVEFIQRIKQRTNTKICLASRPENIYREAYSSFPKMRLQDLTRPDIHHYVTMKLNGYVFKPQIQKDEERREKLVRTIIDKAEGVFLWVNLVLKSLRQGIELRGDNWDILTSRVKEIPSDLNDLYNGMLARLGTDIKFYRCEAAFYLSCVLEGETSVAHLALANSVHPKSVIDVGNPMPPIDNLNSECDKLQHQIESYSAGLLEVDRLQNKISRRLKDGFGRLEGCQWIRFQIDASRRPGDADFPRQTLEKLRMFESHAGRRVRFIHRTVADFLLGISEGQDILRNCHFTHDEIWAKKLEVDVFAALAGSGDLVQYSLFKNYERLPTVPTDVQQTQYNHFLLWCVKTLFLQLADLETLRGRKLCHTSSSLYKVSKNMICQYMSKAAERGDLATIESYVDHVQTIGYQLSHEFKSYLLFTAVSGRHEFSSYNKTEMIGGYRSRHRQVASYLMKSGADPNDMTHDWNWTGLGVSCYQKLAAFEDVVSKMMYSADAGNSPDRSLAFLEKLLERRPGLERIILFHYYAGKRDGLGGTRESVWAVSLASLVHGAIALLAQKGKLGQDVIFSLQRKLPVDAGKRAARLLCIRMEPGAYFTAATLEQPSTFDLVPYLVSGKPPSESPEISLALKNVRDNGKRMTRTELVEWLQSEGYCVTENSPRVNYPDPFDGFKEYYASKPADTSDHSDSNSG